MSGTEVVLSREELFELVWQTPMRKLAPTYGLSDVGLAKICRKHRIPRPGLGHWAKIASGKPSPRPTLPKMDESRLATIRLMLQDSPKAWLREPVEIPVIEVNHERSRLHPLAQTAKQTLKGLEPDHKGLINSPKEICLNISVTRSSQRRGLKLLSALMTYWELNGGSVTTGKRGTVFRMNEDEVSLSLTERIKRIAKPGTRGYWQEFTYKPTGQLTLHILSAPQEIRSTWNDGVKQRLENVLGQVVVNMQRCLTHVRRRRLDQECIARQERAVRAVHKRRQQIETDELNRRKLLRNRIDQWKEAREIREYLAELERKIQKGELTPEDPSFYEQWLVWGHWYADVVCPLTKVKHESPLHEAVWESNILVSELDVTASTSELINSMQISDTNELFRLTSDETTNHDLAWGQRFREEVFRVLEGLGYCFEKKHDE